MGYNRKTIDAWEFFVNYGHGWESEIIELSRAAMLENRKAYRENCPYPLKIVKRRISKARLSAHELESIERKSKR